MRWVKHDGWEGVGVEESYGNLVPIFPKLCISVYIYSFFFILVIQTFLVNNVKTDWSEQQFDF